MLVLANSSCLSQVIVGGGCDGCELMFVDMPKSITSTSYSPAFNDEGQKLLITGKVFANDGVTPAINVIIYYWQTDNKGYYSSKTSQSKKSKRHGYIRGWVKSDNAGNYSIYTIKPKAYPNRSLPAHIHLSIKEPNIKDEYYTDNLVFDYDPLLTTDKRKKLKNRGGSGILRTLISENMIIAEHNIILGLNIPNYPVDDTSIQSGLMVGEDFPSITPYHAWGPDKDTNTCPVCRYGRYLGIMYFVNKINTQEVKDWLLFLEKLSKEQGQYLKVYLIFSHEDNYNFVTEKEQLAQLGKKLNLKHIALTFVPSFQDKKSDVYLTKINPDMRNTIIIYKNRNTIGKFTNLDANEINFSKVKTLIETNRSDYFKLKIDKRKN
jgi:protocatechuate 3,4-dioxygenase beta subunit